MNAPFKRTTLAMAAVALLCSLLICAGGVACGILLVLGKAGAKGPPLPELLPAGLLLGVSLIGGTIRVRKWLTQRGSSLRLGSQVAAVATTERFSGCRQACS